MMFTCTFKCMLLCGKTFLHIIMIRAILLSLILSANAMDNKVEQKQQFLNKIKEEISNKKNPDIEKLIKYIQDTSLLLKNILENKTYTKEQLQEELNKFNKNMQEIEELYQQITNKKEKPTPNDKKKLFKKKQHIEIINLNWQKKTRYHLNDDVQQELTIDNIENYIASHNDISNIASNNDITNNELEKKEIPDSNFEVVKKTDSPSKLVDL